jgi:predicted AAA+ superfamily ATPase
VEANMSDKKKYLNRIVDKEIESKIATFGAILIKGPKWCGKTTSANQFAKSILEMQNPDLQDNYLVLAKTKPSLLLEGDKPRLIDEWQMAPRIWNAVRYSVDKIGQPAQYILTGSSVPIEDSSLHSGTGRFAFVTMKSMTLFESGDSNGKISLQDILNGNKNIDGIRTDLGYEEIAKVLCRGGWPEFTKLSEEQALMVPQNYLEVVCNSDISRVDGVKRNPALAKFILKSYARQVSTIASNSALYDDVRSQFNDVTDKTISDYLDVLKKLYIIDEIEAWNPNIRSKTSIRTSPKKSFVDPSLAVAALGCSPKELMFDPNTYGLLFENLVSRDLSVYVNSIGGRLNHYRDRFGLECDNVIHFNDGRYALVEVKLSGEFIKEAEKHLLELESLIIEKEPRIGKPEFLMVITGTDMAYTTENGILVVPIGCLKN